MIFRLKTSKRTQEIFEELENRTNYKPYTLVKHAIAWSILEKTSVADYKSDSDGLDLNRQTITGDNDTYFKVLIEQVEGRYLTDEEYFPVIRYLPHPILAKCTYPYFQRDCTYQVKAYFPYLYAL